MDKDTKKNYQLYGRNDMIMLDEHNKIYGSLGMAEPYIVATKEGETLLLNGAKDNEPFIGLSLYGKSHQNTVAGNQLLNPELFQENKYQNFNLGNGNFSIANNTLYWITGKIPVEPSTQYSISKANIGGAFYADEYTPITTSAISNCSTTFVTPENCHYICVNFDKKEVPFRSNVMMNKGSTLLPYEPYTGGQPSPNPDYPQEIESVGDDGNIGVDVYGGNLLDAVNEADADVTVRGVTITNNGDGSFTVIGTPTITEGNVFTYYITKGLVLEEGQYALSSGILCRIDKKDGTAQYAANTFTFDSEVDESVYIYWQRKTNNYVDGEIIWPMLNVGSTALPFEPYKQLQSLIVSTPSLPGIPVSSGGNYTDENGQQWVSDEIDFKRGKYVKRVIKYTGPYQVMHWSSSDLWFLFVAQLENIPKPKCRGFCNVSDYFISSWNNLGRSHWFLQVAGHKIVIHLGDKYNTEEAVRQFMDENEIVVYYVAETPIETDLTPEQITAYQSLHTNYPTTTVMNDEGAGMKAIYKQIENGG